MLEDTNPSLKRLKSMADNTSNSDWFYRLLEIRKFPETVTQEEVLRMADDLVFSALGGTCVEQKIADFALNKAAEFTLNNSND